MNALITVVAALWVLATSCAVLAIILATNQSVLHPWRWSIPAAAASVIGVMGFTTWTPVGYFPEVGYTSDQFGIQVRSSWLFIVPLVSGLVGLLVGIWSYKRAARPA
jgi:hypothetical protein